MVRKALEFDFPWSTQNKKSYNMTSVITYISVQIVDNLLSVSLLCPGPVSVRQVVVASSFGLLLGLLFLPCSYWVYCHAI